MNKSTSIITNQVEQLKRWLYKTFVIQKLNNFTGYTILISSSLFLSVVVSYLGVKVGTALFALIVGVPILITSFLNTWLGFSFLIFTSSFVFIISRIVGVDLPFGIVAEGLTYTTLLGMFIDRSKRFSKTDLFGNALNITLSVWIIYTLIQVFNPNATSIEAWIRSLRFTLSGVAIYIIAYRVFSKRWYIMFFTKMWIFIALLAALYGIYQEFAGLPSFDRRWVTSSEVRIGLNFIAGKWRKWSFMADSSVFGVFMAASGVFCIVLSQGESFSFKQKLTLLSMGFLMFIAMAFSGTRTAYVTVPVGLSLYAMMTLNSRSTRLLMIGFAFTLLFILFAPIYNPTFHRLRTAFSPTEDASYQVREENRSFIQPYIHDNPLGGGPNTTGAMGLEYSPNHELAGFPPDSFFLFITLEYGWIGLIINLIIPFAVIVAGVNNYFKVKDPLIKILYAAYLSFIFGLTVACYAKNALFSFPVGYIRIATYVLMFQMIKLQESKSIHRVGSEDRKMVS